MISTKDNQASAMAGSPSLSNSDDGTLLDQMLALKLELAQVKSDNDHLQLELTTLKREFGHLKSEHESMKQLLNKETHGCTQNDVVNIRVCREDDGVESDMGMIGTTEVQTKLDSSHRVISRPPSCASAIALQSALLASAGSRANPPALSSNQPPLTLTYGAMSNSSIVSNLSGLSNSSTSSSLSNFSGFWLRVSSLDLVNAPSRRNKSADVQSDRQQQLRGTPSRNDDWSDANHVASRNSGLFDDFLRGDVPFHRK